MDVNVMDTDQMPESAETQRRVENVYRSEKHRFMARLRAAGRTLEEAEDFIHDIYIETMEKWSLLPEVHSLPAWINSLFSRRMIDAWRHEKVRKAAGETDVAEETLREIICGVGLNPLDEYVQEAMVDALNSALKALPALQRQVVEAQVFGGMTFREIAESTGENIDTLKARKRYALKNLTRALRHWIID